MYDKIAPTTMSVPKSASVALPDYIELVNRCALERLNFVIANGSPVHARILIAKLFEIAKSDVHLISGKLCQTNQSGVDIYNHRPLIEQAKDYLRRPGTSFSVIFQRGAIDRADKNEFLSEIASDPKRQGIISLIVPRANTLGAEVPHFMVSDGSAYRLETGEQADPTNQTHSAVANFGDFPTARSLRAYFSELVAYLKTDSHLEYRRDLPPGSNLIAA